MAAGLPRWRRVRGGSRPGRQRSRASGPVRRVWRGRGAHHMAGPQDHGEEAGGWAPSTCRLPRAAAAIYAVRPEPRAASPGSVPASRARAARAPAEQSPSPARVTGAGLLRGRPRSGPEHQWRCGGGGETPNPAGELPSPLQSHNPCREVSSPLQGILITSADSPAHPSESPHHPHRAPITPAEFSSPLQIATPPTPQGAPVTLQRASIPPWESCHTLNREPPSSPHRETRKLWGELSTSYGPRPCCVSEPHRPSPTTQVLGGEAPTHTLHSLAAKAGSRVLPCHTPLEGEPSVGTGPVGWSWSRGGVGVWSRCPLPLHVSPGWSVGSASEAIHGWEAGGPASLPPVPSGLWVPRSLSCFAKKGANQPGPLGCLLGG